MAARFLIVDDHERFRELARMLLENEGHQVVGEAGDAAEAMKAVLEVDPDALLIDVNLPGQNGFDLAARLLHERPDRAVVITSIREGEYFHQLARNMGARGFIVKNDLSGETLTKLLG